MHYAYTRVSTVEQADGTSLDHQQRIADSIATLHGGALAQTFTDAGVSGSVPLHTRPAGTRLLSLLCPGDTVIAAKLDRIFRSTKDALATIEDFHQRDVALIVADISTEPVTESGIGRMFLTIMSAVGEFERSRITERCDEGRAAKKARGGATNHAPFGYRKIGEGREAVLVPDTSEQAIIDLARALRIEGLTYRAISERLTVGGHLSRCGTPLNPSTIRSICNRQERTSECLFYTRNRK